MRKSRLFMRISAVFGYKLLTEVLHLFVFQSVTKGIRFVTDL